MRTRATAAVLALSCLIGTAPALAQQAPRLDAARIAPARARDAAIRSANDDQETTGHVRNGIVASETNKKEQMERKRVHFEEVDEVTER
jgi:hypothetical protein